jgi:hypothetical protein
VLDQDRNWDSPVARVWAIGEHAVVSTTAVQELPSTGGHANMALVHSGAGVLWRGTEQAVSDYLPTLGFTALTREGYLLLNGGGVIDPSGTRRDPPEGFVLAERRIDAEGRVLVHNHVALGYWHVPSNEILPLGDARLHSLVTGPAALNELSSDASALLARDEQGGLALARVTPEGADVASLPSAITWRIDALLGWSDPNDSLQLIAGATHALLVLDLHPIGWVPEHGELRLYEETLDWPPLSEIHRFGDCFSGAPIRASTTDELLAGFFRIEPETGELSTGLVHPIPAGLSAVLPGDGHYAQPSCDADGRAWVLLRGLAGDAWFREGDSALEQASGWNERLGVAPIPWREPDPDAKAPRVLNGLQFTSWTRAAGDCEIQLLDDGITLVDLESSLEHRLGPTAYAAWLGD